MRRILISVQIFVIKVLFGYTKRYAIPSTNLFPVRCETKFASEFVQVTVIKQLKLKMAEGFPCKTSQLNLSRAWYEAVSRLLERAHFATETLFSLDIRLVG